jgi:RHH-type proline utilization regulon transcriptional repressor/proline dehydrogenase/delta 1-pyrroline-5-carboxylate dehydrogenase
MTPPQSIVDLLGQGLRALSPSRAAIARATRLDEPHCVQALLASATLGPETAQATQALAQDLVTRLRQPKAGASRDGLVQALMQEFSLSTQEGVALMCMAEALLRIPDDATRDALIRDKIADTNWVAHLGHSPSLFVNAATWGLMLTGKLMATHGESGLSAALKRAAARGGEPVIRKAVDVVMRLLGEQFVVGETIGKALHRARQRQAQGFTHSFDMLGEAALTEADALRYTQAYEYAIHAIGQAAQGQSLYEGPGISVKLSALHPRYSRSQYDRVMDALYPRLLHLATLACHHGIGLNIDAEESERLDLSLDLLERLCLEPALQDWDGIGFVVQAYQKRCPLVIDHLIELARRSRHRLMVRLVKGAYWDSEIKQAQVLGLPDYPVYTRKVHTDMAYLACARKMLAAPAEIFAQFATHNAQTLAAVYHLAGPDFQRGQYEFQCLHGMGEALHELVVAGITQGGLARPCRIYAPVGTHETLLPYLVRRLLENGANTSFVNRLADASVSVDELVADPVAQILAAAQPGHEAAHGAGQSESASQAQHQLEAHTPARRLDVGTGPTIGAPHPGISLPCALAGPSRVNAPGLDLNDEPTLQALHAALNMLSQTPLHVEPMLATLDDASAVAPADALAGAALQSPSHVHLDVPGAKPASAPGAAPAYKPATALNTATQAATQPAPQKAASAPPQPSTALSADHTPPVLCITNPAQPAELVGTARSASLLDVAQAARTSVHYAPRWQDTPVAQRAAWLDAAADLMAQRQPQFMALLVREAGKTWPNALGEVREAIDFLRYYAAQARTDLHTQLRGGQAHSLGPIVCISPWNFPLAIFTGQIAAALAAGNPVLAKPAEQTPLIAAQAVALLHEAGVPRPALQLLPGEGDTVGAALVAQPGVAGVVFTGSTGVARLLQAQLAPRLNTQGRPLRLIAETGGQNAMIVDSSALPEQVVKDVLTSAFDSAGQRCSALRVLCLQHDMADTVVTMLQGAMNEQRVGPGACLHTDVGPLIDARALQAVQAYIEAQRALGRRVYQAPHALEDAQAPATGALAGHFCAPTLIELPAVSALGHEVFGPVLHVLRFARSELPQLIEQINDLGYGLTLGIHSRIDETIQAITEQARVGNIYVNRNMVGAVVGVQPFGGEGLSGTGPKAGGPLYLHALCAPSAEAVRGLPEAGPVELGKRANAAPVPTRLVQVTPAPTIKQRTPQALRDLHTWLATATVPHARTLREYTHWLLSSAVPGLPCASTVLPGPVGERNTYIVQPREAVLCVAGLESDLLYQAATVLAAGSHMVWLHTPSREPLWLSLPPGVQARIHRVNAMPDRPLIDLLPQVLGQTRSTSAALECSAVLMHGQPADITAAAQLLAQLDGPIIGLQALPQGWRQPGAFSLRALLREQTVSVNTAAAGGDTQLLTLD